MGIQTALDAVVNAERVVDALRLSDDLAFEAASTGGARTIRILGGAIGSGDGDQLTTIAAIHALARVFDEQADVVLSSLLSSDRAYVREHAALALGSRLPRFDTVARLIGLVSRGGFAGMVAQRVLEQWAPQIPDHVAIGVEGALVGTRDAESRYRLVETLGLVRGRIARRPLLSIAGDAGEDERVRVAAVAALGQRRGEAAIVPFLETLSAGAGFVAAAARLAIVDLSAGDPSRDAPGADPDQGLTVAQLFLHADIDADLTQAGSGDNGGIATLLVRLGDELAGSGARVARVITLSRGSVSGALGSVAEIAAREEGHAYGRVPLLSDPVQSANAWPLRVAARRGIRRILRAAGHVDVLHLRMADVGSLAAADVARELAIPVVFTVAPDPHAVIHSLDLAGTLTRWNFGDADAVEHYWFRTRLVQQLAANASHTVLFPRPRLREDMRSLVGIDLTEHPERHTVVPEGIDLGVVDRAVAEAGAFDGVGLDELRDLLAALPAERRGLPLLISVGRFHRVKGMASIVEAWASAPLRDRANLMLVGGDLESPSADELQQLDAIDRAVPPDERRESGLLLPGHRPNDVVARWVAAARFGVPGLTAPGGVYVCGSLKEEFGIALLEAMGAGLMVVAPDGGGPATYVEDGVTGILTRTWDVEALGDGIAAALDLSQAEVAEPAAGEARAARSRATVEASFTIQAMARALVDVYGTVALDEAESRAWAAALR
jgi:glycosyltransferase involved in cell wall biosynthesis